MTRKEALIVIALDALYQLRDEVPAELRKKLASVRRRRKNISKKGKRNG